MNDLTSYLPITDIRDAITPPLANRAQGRRDATNYVVVHYNGPPAPARAGSSRDDIIDWLNEIIVPNHVTRIPSDGVQYHLWIAADGTIYQTRDFDTILWHCGNLEVNRQSLAVHVPVGGHQHPTDKQIQALYNLLQAALECYGLDVEHIKGHCEVGASECPGPVLLPLLRQWRTDGCSRRYRVIDGIDFAQVREAPHIRAAEAHIGADSVRLMPGWVVEIDEIRQNWAHIASPAPWGWIHTSLLRLVDADAPIGPPDVRTLPVNDPAKDDLRFVNPPRISKDLFVDVLRRHRSPAYPMAEAMYDACADEEVDPALLLAFFQHESSFGKAGLCVQYNLANPGNVRTPMNAERGRQLQIPGRGAFFQFYTWELGAQDWAERMRDKYTRDLALPTARTALPTYAPKSDNNDPAHYAEKVIRQVRSWQQEDHAS